MAPRAGHGTPYAGFLGKRAIHLMKLGMIVDYVDPRNLNILNDLEMTLRNSFESFYHFWLNLLPYVCNRKQNGHFVMKREIL